MFTDNAINEKTPTFLDEFNYTQQSSLDSSSNNYQIETSPPPPPLPPRLYRKASDSFDFSKLQLTHKREDSITSHDSSANSSSSGSHFSSCNSLSRSNTLPVRISHQIHSLGNDSNQTKSFNSFINTTRQKFSSSGECTSLVPSLKTKLTDKSGFMYKTGSDCKHFSKRWCTLTSNRLIYFEKEQVSINEIKSEPKGFIDLENTAYLSHSSNRLPLKSNNRGFVHRKSVTNNKPDSGLDQFAYTFEIGVQSSNGRIYLFAASSEEDFHDWFVNIILRVEPQSRSLINYEDVSFAGYMHLKIGISGSWMTCWLALKNRELIIISELKSSICDQDVLKIDLRKIMSISYSSPYQISSCATVQEKGQPIHLDRNNDTVIYIQGDYKSHTDAFFSIITKTWTVPINGYFDDQLLSSSDIPIAIEKCLNFICTYGGLTQKDIYSISGDDVMVNNLFSNLKNNKICRLHISAENGYTVHEVASALKKYLRSFPESVYTDKLFKDWVSNDVVKNREKRLHNIKMLLKKLPKVNFLILKKLLCHFCW